jgi:DNA repair protein RadD
VIQLRSYQRRVLDDLYAWFHRHPTGNCIVNACVGAGKSVVIAALCHEAKAKWPETRIVMCVPSQELCRQNLDKLLALWPNAPAHVFSAALGRREMGADILYATIGSIYKRAHEMGRVDLLLIDEVHLLGESETGMYRKLIADLLIYNPAMRVVGLTGTDFRGNGVFLTDQDNPLLHGTAAIVTMDELLEAGYLAPLTTEVTQTQIDTSQVAIQRGDYAIAQLAAAADKAAIVDAACDEMVALAAQRRMWLVFAVTVEHAHHIAEALRLRGVMCEVVSANTPQADRVRHVADFKGGRLRALVNVATLTTGFDAPEVDCIALLRATKSPVMYTQIMGRGMRTAPGKTDCLVLDFTNTVATLGPVNKIKGHPRPPKKIGATAPFRVCDQCGSHNHATASQCIDCGFKFPEPERIKHGAMASTAQVLAFGAIARQVTRRPVSRVEYRHHIKQDSPSSLRVDYFDGLQQIASEWVTLNHAGWARAKAESWWMRRKPDTAQGMVPGTVAQALDWINSGYQLKEPTALVLDESGRYKEIKAYEWATEEAIA